MFAHTAVMVPRIEVLLVAVVAVVLARMDGRMVHTLLEVPTQDFGVPLPM